MAEKRGLFQKIFGNKKERIVENQQFRLLNSWQTTFVPFSGNSYDVNIVRAAVDSFARRAAIVKPKHIRREEDKINDITRSKINILLQFKPNPYSSAYKFYYRLATQYKLYNNAFIYPVWNLKNGELEALYNINANSIELVEHNNELFCKLSFNDGKTYTCAYSDLIHISSHVNNNDIFGESNKPIASVLKTALTFNESMSKYAELVSVIRGILKAQVTTKADDLNKRRDEFIKDNLRMENNGAGIIITDSKYDYTPLNDKQTPIPAAQLQYVKSEVYDYFGTNENIVQNKESSEEANAYFNGELKPFFEQLSQALTNGLFSGKQPSFGNEIICEGSRLQNEKLSEKTTAVKFLAEIGAITIDQALSIYNLPTIGGEEGSRRVQTLNMVNANKADKYQLGEEDNLTEKKEVLNTNESK